MRRYIWFFSLIILLAPISARAHSGGLPYVMVNDQYVNSNPLGGAYPELAQDLAPTTYIVGKPIKFAIDTTRITPNDTQYRWKWDSASPGDEATSLSHTFDHAGSYFIVIEAKNQFIPEFTQLDTLQVNAVPSEGYKLASVQVFHHYDPKTRESSFSAVPKAGSASIKSYEWTFGDGATAKGAKTKHRYDDSVPQYSVFPVLKATDANGLYQEVAFELDKTESGVAAKDLPFMTGVITSQAPPAIPSSIYSIVGIIGGISLLIVGIWLFLRRSRQRK